MRGAEVVPGAEFLDEFVCAGRSETIAHCALVRAAPAGYRALRLGDRTDETGIDDTRSVSRALRTKVTSTLPLSSRGQPRRQLAQWLQPGLPS